MNKFLFSLVMIAMSSASAFAGEHVLNGADARSALQILEAAGIQANANSLEAFDVVCEGQNFEDRCLASRQGSDPATSRVEFSGAAASEFWSLLKRAGFQSFVSEISDGSAGETIIQGGNVNCSGGQCSFE
jgi:hypothetical protein